MKNIAKKEFVNGFVSLNELEDGKRIETTATCLPLSTEMRGTDRTNNYATDYNVYERKNWQEKAMIGVSTQSGCPVKCKFCAVNELTEKQGWRNLTYKEIVDQVVWANYEIYKSTGHWPSTAKLFRILFTRMGEPALNHEEVIKAIVALKKLYPKARIQVSTIGFGKHSARLVTALARIQVEFKEQFIELQYSIHSTSDEYRRWLQHEKVSPNLQVHHQIAMYHTILKSGGVPINWKTTLNFALTTETPFEINSLKAQFSTADVFIKVSPINENTQTEKNEIKGIILQTNSI